MQQPSELPEQIEAVGSMIRVGNALALPPEEIDRLAGLAAEIVAPRRHADFSGVCMIIDSDAAPAPFHTAAEDPVNRRKRAAARAAKARAKKARKIARGCR